MQRFTRFILIFIVLILTRNSLIAQRFSTGYLISAIGYQNLKYADKFIFSPNSYMIYYAGNEKRDFEPSYAQYLNGIGLGLNFNIDYKRYMLSLELQGGATTIKTSLIAPNELNNTVYETNTIDFKIEQVYTSIALLGSYKLSSKANGLFLQLGSNVSFNRFEEKKDFSNIISFNLSPYELYGTLYSNQNIFFNGLAGLGWKWDNSYLSARFIKRLKKNNDEYPTATIYQIQAVYARTLSFQKLRKGYNIYLE
jgi:hypothetical protein